MISNTEILKRSISLLGEESIKKLENSKIIIFGVGGVGSFETIRSVVGQNLVRGHTVRQAEAWQWFSLGALSAWKADPSLEIGRAHV